MPLIIPANTLSGGYEVANSCRFNDDDSAYMHKTCGTATLNTKFTISLWVKRGNITSNQYIIWSGADVNNTLSLRFRSDDKLQLYSAISGSDVLIYKTTRLFRDVSAWYAITVAVDTTQGTAGDRVKIYINGTEETALDDSDNPNQDTAFAIMSSNTFQVGRRHDNTSSYFDGYLAEVVFIDGTAYAASDFGEFDEDSPTIWKPKDVSGLTFGTNGFYLDFEDSANLGNDANGGTDLTEVNLAATDQSSDSPTNNFATLNPLMGGRGSTLSEGNLKVTNESDNNYDVATFGSDMKWYYEWKVDENYDGAGGGVRLGAIHIDELSTNDNLSGFTNAKVKLYTNSNDGKTQEGGGDNVITSLTRATTNDIIMCACDGTNAKIWWGINGTWLDYGSGTGDPGAGSNAAPWSSNAMASGIYFPVICYSGTAAAGSLNLGNPPFSISSGNSDANGYGNFEYAVPNSFYSLCTKNLAEFG